MTDVFRKDGRAVPVFNDKHLSWKWEWAKEMVDLSRELKFPFLAGSSLPVTWRMPSIEMPYGAEVEEMLCVGDRRRGQLRLPRPGDDPVHGRTASRGRDRRRGRPGAAGRRRSGKRWTPADGTRAAGTLGCSKRASRGPRPWRNPPTFSDRYPTPEQIREWVKDPVAYRIEYNDGTRATMLLMNGLVSDFTFAARLKGQAEPLSTLFYLPPNPNVVYSAALMSKAEETVPHRQAALPDRADAAHDRPGRSLRPVAGDRAGPHRDAAPGDRLPGAADSLFART